MFGSSDPGARPRALVVRRGECAFDRVAALSWMAWAQAAEVRDPELWIVESTTSGTLRSSMQNAEMGAAMRASGGAEVALAPGVLCLMLVLPHLSALEPVRTDVILNRHVRPLLRAVSRSGALAHYFGRDWISAKHRPVAQVAFAHESASQRTLVEAFVSVGADACPRRRASYLGKEPVTLCDVAGRDVSTAEVGDQIERAYLDAHGLARKEATLPAAAHLADVPGIAVRPDRWRTVHDEAIGPIAIGLDAAGRLRLGGEAMISFDALERLEAELETLGPLRREREEVERVVRAALSPAEVAVFGVTSLDTIVSVVVDDAAGE